MQVLLPVTRDHTRAAVVASLADSDIPRCDLVLVVDGPCDGDAWERDLTTLGFRVARHDTGAGEPPSGRMERRQRHHAMRVLTQSLVDDGELLCIEDDGTVPRDVYARLSAIGPNASGVQVTRHGTTEVGVYIDGRHPTAIPDSGAAHVDGCGLFALLTTGEAYGAPFAWSGEAVDLAQTRGMGVTVDWGCRVGHITDHGTILPMKEYGMAGETFVTLDRVVRGGMVIAGKRERIPLQLAVDIGLCDAAGRPLDTAVYDEEFRQFVPVTEVKGRKRRPKA